MVGTFVAAVAAALWVYLAAFRGRFWSARDELSPAGEIPPRSVAVVIPARDEAPVICRALASLFAQDYPGPLHIIVVDDQSSDGTEAVAREAAVAYNAADRLTVLTGPPKPAGWTGKLWAVQLGVAAARRSNPDYLLLTDADIAHGRQSLRRLVAHAEAGGFDLVSLMVRLHCRSAWERLLIPAFVFFFFKLYPPRWVADRQSRTAAAAGGCMLVRPQALERIGGIESIRHEIIDDCALARRVKAGGAIWLGAATGSCSIREYGSWRPIWDMIARCAFAQLGYSTLALIGTVAMMGIIYLAPPLLAIFAEGWARLLGGAAWLIMAAVFVPILRSYRCPVWLAPLLPAMAAFYTAATIASAVQFWRGRGGSWKGRYQAASAG